VRQVTHLEPGGNATEVVVEYIGDSAQVHELVVKASAGLCVADAPGERLTRERLIRIVSAGCDEGEHTIRVA
jgi:hypothetical protein